MTKCLNARSIAAVLAALAVLALAPAVPASGQTTDDPGGSAQAPAGDRPSTLLFDERLAAVAAQVPEFGGLYLDERGRTLLVNVTQRRPGLVADLRDAIRRNFPEEDLPNPIRLVDAQFSFTQLHNWKQRGRELFAIDGVGSIDIDERAGLLTIGVTEPGNEDEIAAELAAQNIPPDGWTIETVEPMEPASNVNDRHRPVLGGLQIAIGGGGLCTYGVTAFRGDQLGFITNSHCTTTQGGVESTTYEQPVSTSDGRDRIGIEAADPTYFTVGCPYSASRCRYSDSAFVRAVSGVSYSRSVVENPVGSLTWNGTSRYPVVADGVSPPVGTFLEKVGRTTGRTNGKVTDTCVDANAAGTNLVLLCQNMTNIQIAPGDSGSPVFRTQSCTVSGQPDVCARVYGLIWGGGFSASVYSPIVNIQRSDELGPLTTCFTGNC